MTAAERQRLARILGMLGSDQAGEQAAAAFQAEAFRKRHGLTWAQLLTLPPVEVAPEPVWESPPESPPPEPSQWTPSDPIPPEWLSPRPGPWTRRWYKSVKAFHTTCEIALICMFLFGCAGLYIPPLVADFRTYIVPLVIQSR
jgi:hypothetical protein